MNSRLDFEDLAPSEANKPHIYTLDKNGNPYSKSWSTVNILLSYSPSENVRMNLGVDNLFDLAYRPYSSGIAAPGRNFIVSLRYTLL